MAVKKASARRGRERRASERADARLSMRVDAGAVAGATRIVTESQNISSSGVYCHASHYLAPLSKVQLTIVLPRVPGSGSGPPELVKCDAIVVRCGQRPGGRTETPYDLACMFSGLELTLRSRIAEFVTWRNLQALRAAVAPAGTRRKTVRLAAAGGGGARKKAVARASKAVRKARPKTAARASSRQPASRGGRSGR
jgi:hypothetical protein